MGPKSWKYYAWKGWNMTDHDFRPNSASDQKEEEKKISKKNQVFFQFFCPGHGLVSNCNLPLCDYFTCNFFMPLAAKNQNIWKKEKVIALLGFLTILAFKILKKLNFCLKIYSLKILSKNSVSYTHSATPQIWWQNWPKWSIWKEMKMHFWGHIWGDGQI